MGKLGASCFHLFSDNKRRIEKEAWDAERFGMVCTSSNTLAHMKTALEQLCADTNRCTYETERLIEAANRELSAFQHQIEILSQ